MINTNEWVKFNATDHGTKDYYAWLTSLEVCRAPYASHNVMEAGLAKYNLNRPLKPEQILPICRVSQYCHSTDCFTIYEPVAQLYCYIITDIDQIKLYIGWTNLVTNPLVKIDTPEELTLAAMMVLGQG